MRVLASLVKQLLLNSLTCNRMLAPNALRARALRRHGNAPALATRTAIRSGSSSSSRAPTLTSHIPACNPIDAYLSSLNQEQQAAVHSTNSVVRVKAGPGSGKTRVVTARVANLLKRGEPASGILVITFTNKAATELKERLQSILGNTRGSAGVSAGTFHSICARILRNFVTELPSVATGGGGAGLRQMETLNLTETFSILDADDSKRAMRKVVESFLPDGGAKQSSKLADVLCEIYSHIRSQYATLHNGFSWTKAMDKLDLSKYTQAILPFREADLPDCFDMYDKFCRDSNAVDFDDLLSLTVALLQQAQGVRQRLHELWRHVLVDEFQDTNAAQYEMVRLLRGANDTRCTTFVVGDSDQAIYSWRGANPDNMDVEFKKNFPSCATMFLSSNYRSGSDIVDAAEAVLSHAGLPQLHQSPIPMKKTAGHVQYVATETERHEPYWVTSKICELQRAGANYKDMAVIYRVRTQSRLFQEALAGAGVPFRVLGDKPFWSRSEIKVMTCYLRLTANPATDTMALDEVINMPARKIGPKSLQKLVEVAKGTSTSLAGLLLGDLRTMAPLAAAELQPLLDEVERSGALPPAALDLLPDVGSALSKQHKLKLTKDAVAGLRQLRAVIYLARCTAMQRPVDAVVNLLQLTSGFLSYIQEEGNQVKEGNLQVLRNIAANPDAWISREEDLKRQQAQAAASGGGGQLSTLEQLQLFLQHVALMRDLDEHKEKDKEGQRVTLMTIHASKGLEFENVFFVGFEDGLVPLIRKKDADQLSPDELSSSLSEEKRLAYVGCTRAMDRLFLVRAQARSLYGGGGAYRNETKPSRFLAELSKAGVNVQRSL